MRTGIYGGTFAPPHVGHIAAARAFLSEMALDELLIVPAFIPPHKTVGKYDDPAVRLEMCRIAFSGLERTTVSTVELDRGGKSYTSDTLEALSAPGRELFLLCGTDMMLTLGNWHLPEVIFRLATPVCIRRENEPETGLELTDTIKAYRERFGVDVPILKAAHIELSSTEIRDAVKNGRDISGTVPKGVEKYIIQNGLYK